MKCKHCGEEIANDSKFCEFCGKKVKRKKKWPWIVGVSAIISVVIVVFFVINAGENNDFEPNKCYSYDQLITEGNESVIVKSFFVFRTPEDVVWLMGTPCGNFFPVGFGKYNSETDMVAFQSSDLLHQEIALYRGLNDVTFLLNRDNHTAQLMTDDRYLKLFYNNGNTFSLTDNGYWTFDESFVGSRWEAQTEYGKIQLYFASWNEVVVTDDYRSTTVAYISAGEYVAIKSGDNLDDENLIGTVEGTIMILCRDGIFVPSDYDDRPCFAFKKI